MKILVTGGCGYIGSHTCVELLNNGYEVVVIDNLSNSKKSVIDRVETITSKHISFYEGDVRDKELLTKIFSEHKIDSVMHFAGLKSLNESIEQALDYYSNNIGSTLKLLQVMKEFNVKSLIFSSSAAVYGDHGSVKYDETMECKTPNNPYGRTKAMIETILQDLYVSDPEWKITLLRYFNPVGAHESGLIGEIPDGVPNNLMPYVVKVATGELPKLTIFGDDYDTEDGTCIRDFIHVVDLAKGHVKALEHYEKVNNGIFVYNLGTGHGCSVKEIVINFEKANNVKINYVIGERRPGDLSYVIADPTKAYNELGWKTEKDLFDMCRDSYNYAIKYKEQNK